MNRCKTVLYRYLFFILTWLPVYSTHEWMEFNLVFNFSSILVRNCLGKNQLFYSNIFLTKYTHIYNERQRASYVNRFEMMISVAAFIHRLLNYFTSLLILVTIGDGGNRLFLYLLYTRLLIHFSPHRCYGDHRRLPCRSSSWVQSCFIRKWLTRMEME